MGLSLPHCWLGSAQAILLVFGTIMSFTTRGVNDNFNESRPIAFSVSCASCSSNVQLKRCSLSDLQHDLHDSDCDADRAAAIRHPLHHAAARVRSALVSCPFAAIVCSCSLVFRIALLTYIINFVPKILALYKNALGLLPDLITGSKVGNTSQNSGDFAVSCILCSGFSSSAC
jgi:hypothetical protein